MITRAIRSACLAAFAATALVAQSPAASQTASPRAAAAPIDGAIDKLSAFVQNYPDSPLRPEALYQLGELLIRRADEQFAVSQRAASASGGNATLDRPDYVPAIARYQELIKKYPKFDRIDAAAYTLGTLLFSQDRYADAAQNFAMAAGMPSSHYRPESFFRLGDSYFEMAAKSKGDPRKKLFVQAATAYDSATLTAPPGGDIYFMALYKLGWSYYNQATKAGQPEYSQAVDTFGRLVTEYDALTPDQQARLGLKRETIDYMAVSLTQVGGAAASDKYFAAHPKAGASLELTLLRRIAANLRDQGDFPKAVAAYQEIQQKAPTDSSALGVQQDIIDIYQNRILVPESAQVARLRMVDDFGPSSAWAKANPKMDSTARLARETALRQSAQYALNQAQKSKDKDKTVQAQKYATAAALYSRYLSEFSTADSSQQMAFYNGEANFGAGNYVAAGEAYTLAAFALKTNDPKLAQKAGQDAIASYDSATVRGKGDAATQDSLFAAVDRYANAFPDNPLAKTALIEKGKRASEAKRWDVVEATFRQYVAKYPNDAYIPTAQKLIGDAMYKQGSYGAAQAQWETAGALAASSGKKALADSITSIRNAAAVTFGDSLVKSGNYDQAAKEVYIAYADRNPKSPKAPDALRNAVEVYMLADSVARAKGDQSASTAARQAALSTSDRLVREYPTYKYKTQYQALNAQLLGELGQKDSAVKVLTVLASDPKWPGRPEAMVRIAVDYDSLGKHKEAAQAYETFAKAYPKDKRAADAQYNAAATYLEAGDSADAARALATFAKAYPADSRRADAQAERVALLKGTGANAAAESEMATLCVKPSAPMKATCADRAGSAAFKAGQDQWSKYQAIQLVISKRTSLTKAGVTRLSAPKKAALTKMDADFTKAINSGSPEWIAAGSYYAGLAQWEYGNFLSNVTLPKELTDQERQAATAGAAKQAETYYQAANKTWKALVDKAAQEKFTNAWVDRAAAALTGKVDASPKGGAP